MRSLLLAVGLPLAFGFGTLKKGMMDDADVEIGTESAGCKQLAFQPTDQEYLFGDDFCTSLQSDGTALGYTVLGEGPTGGKCGQETNMLKCTRTVKENGYEMTATGTAAVFDQCAWDYDKNRCRKAAYAYFCHMSCPNMPQGGTYRSSSASNLQTSTRTRLIEGAGGLEGRQWVEATVAVQYLTWGGRRLEVSSSRQPEKEKPLRKRRLSFEDNCGYYGGTVEEVAAGKCCTVTDANVAVSPFFKDTVVTEARSNGDIISVGSDGDEGVGVVSLKQTCYVDNGSCKCDPATEGEIVANDLCVADKPTLLGANGAGCRR